MNEFFSKVAPTLASALLGPMAGVAVAGIGKILGLDNATTKDIAQAINDGKITPEHLAEIRKLELQYQADEAERGFKYVELTFKDSDSARQMQIATKSVVPAVLAGIVTTGFFGILIFMIVNSDYKPTEPLLILLGALSTSWATIIGFYFGSSHGSQSKDILLSQPRSKP